MDDSGLEDSQGAHRQSSNEFVKWLGRSRCALFIGILQADLPFLGRQQAVNGLIDHALKVIVAPPTRSDIVFAHASPGVGKTRLLYELVEINGDLVKKQTVRIMKKSLIRKEQEKYLQAFHKVLPVAISVNGVTSVRGILNPGELM